MTFLVSQELMGKITESDLYKDGKEKNAVMSSEDSIVAILDNKFFNVIAIDLNPFYEDGYYTKILKIDVPNQPVLLRAIFSFGKRDSFNVCFSDDCDKPILSSDNNEFTLSSIDKSLSGNSYVATIVIRNK